jgi:hypothetical protein
MRPPEGRRSFLPHCVFAKDRARGHRSLLPAKFIPCGGLPDKKARYRVAQSEHLDVDLRYQGLP